MKRIAMLTLLATACASRTAAPPAAGSPPKGPDEAHTVVPAQADGPGPEKQWGKGWAYRGSRSNCFFVHAGICFRTQAKACAHAACVAPSQCVVDGAGPARVRCS